MRTTGFQGVASLRVGGERLAFWLTLIFAFPIAGAIGFFLHQSIGLEQVALFIIAAMIYVTLARGRLIGSSVMIHEAQYPRVFSIVRRTCATLDIPMPLIFVREDHYVPAAALGFGEPYALILSSDWIESFQDDELSFIIGRQLGHIATGHARYNSILSVNGRENAVIAAIFGAWLRRCELTCDRIGLLCCGSLDAAMRAIAVENFHHFGRHIDMAMFAEQNSEVQSDPILRWGQWLGGEPYATTRIAAMRRFMASSQYEAAETWFLRSASEHPPQALPVGAHVEAADCAGWWRRLTAVTIDAVIVFLAFQAISSAATDVLQHKATESAAVLTLTQESPRPSARPNASAKPSPTPVPTATPNTVLRLPLGQKLDVSERVNASGEEIFTPGDLIAIAFLSISWFWFPIYNFVLVALAGQTFGMMITGLRVVTIDYKRPTVTVALWRYIVATLIGWLALLLSPVQRRVMLHDRVSGTRLIRSERVLARTAQRSGS